MGEWFSQQAASGSLALALPVALIAGLVSFFSPCVIPLLPGYLSYATGLSGADLASGRAAEHRGRMFWGSLLFVLGFSFVFVAFGSLSGAIGSWLWHYRSALTIGLGVLTIVLGLMFAGWLPIGQRDWRVHAVPAVGVGAAPLLGVLFGLGWMPCVGPTLGAITALSVNEATAGRGALLSGVYAFGLGVPFVIAGLAYERALRAFTRIRRHQQLITRLGGILLIAVGVLLVTGLWNDLVTWLQVSLVGTTELVI